ncbi:protein EVI2A [Dasypus novemcinctus]|uniref:protein EVI2A n=1 Tax=Dasypus novemcinctus TaxID=9361 RepID=UPI0003291018|nr:protein EVI2A [Dasypus novemcinctus]
MCCSCSGKEMCHLWFGFKSGKLAVHILFLLQIYFKVHNLQVYSSLNYLEAVLQDKKRSDLLKITLYSDFDQAFCKISSILTDMELTGYYHYLTFVMTTIISLSPGTKANYTHLWADNTTVWDPVIQNKTGRNQRENTNANPTTSEVDYKVNSTKITEIATPSHIISLTPKSEDDLYIPSVFRNSSLAAQSNISKNHSEIFKKDVCEENNNKMAVLVCLIIIAVLFLICTLLFLSTVILANQVSSIRQKQAGKRQPRSNGDFLASSGLWPAESDTWKRAKQFTGPNLMMQSAGMPTATRERKDEEGTEKLTNRSFNDEKCKVAMSKVME